VKEHEWLALVRPVSLLRSNYESTQEKIKRKSGGIYEHTGEMVQLCSFSPPDTLHLAISPTASGQPHFLADAQNPPLLQWIMMESRVVEVRLVIIRIMVDGCVQELLTKG